MAIETLNIEYIFIKIKYSHNYFNILIQALLNNYTFRWFELKIVFLNPTVYLRVKMY